MDYSQRPAPTAREDVVENPPRVSTEADSPLSIADETAAQRIAASAVESHLGNEPVSAYLRQAADAAILRVLDGDVPARA